MRVSKEQFQQNRENILRAAARLFRERGYEAVGVADVMKAAGLTHGGFYGHFKSKEDLFAQATSGPAPTQEAWTRLVDEGGLDALGIIACEYLSQAHLTGVGAGCMIAALGPEIARQPGPAREQVTQSIKTLLQTLAKASPGSTEAERRAYALKAYASWIGAMVLARVSDDEAFSREVLETVAEA